MAAALRKSRLEALTEELRLFSPFAERIENEAALNDRFRRARLAALCLSGGGIRSAAFCLGVIQVLAEEGLLKQFHYLSTVSGGGYIGTWLQALIRRTRGNRIASVEEEIAHSNGAPDPVRFLRNYTSYLSPETGLLSTDIWADIVLWVRNTLLTWACCAPLILIPVVLALVYRTAIWAFDGSILQRLLPLLGLLCLFAATAFGAVFLPKRGRRRGRAPLLAAILPVLRAVRGKSRRLAFLVLRSLLYRRSGAYVRRADIVWRAVLPSVCWAFLAPFAVSGMTNALRAGLLVPWYIGVVLLAYVVAGLCQWRLWRVYLPNFFRAWIWATLVSSLAVWGGLALAAWVGVRNQAQALAVFGPLWLLAVSGLHTIVFVGLVKDGRLADLDREWLARFSALKLKWGTLWALIAAPCLLLSWLFDQYTSGPAAWSWLVTLASGPIAAWFGKQAYAKFETFEKSNRQQALGLGLDALSAVFLLGLLAFAGYAVDKWWSGAVLQDRLIRGLLLASEPLRESARGAWLLTEHGRIYLDYLMGGPVLHEELPSYITFELSAWVPFGALFVTLVMLAGILCVLWRTVNVNRFSMHAVYRNRLIRAFLGAARESHRKPDGFTDFDPNDNFGLFSCLDRTPRGRLFPVINMTLNLTHGGPAAWSERKALAFTATPLACGAAMLSKDQKDPETRGAYVSTAMFAGREGRSSSRLHSGLSIGTAMAISGAAVSPNWGYHSRMLTAFMMTLFNMRLGAWLPNPAADLSPEELALAKPRRGLATLARDLLGRADSTSNAIYLSDGGHFDNLGLYEMLRRRCRLILVIDAGEDGSCKYADLGGALRKAAIDMGIAVEFEAPWRIASRTDAEQKQQEALGFLIGRIRYPDARKGQESRLLYVKPSLLDRAPADVRAYANRNLKFPHEPTLDQWFTESQFESYRSLAEFQMRELLKHVHLQPRRDLRLRDVFSAAEAAYWQARYAESG